MKRIRTSFLTRFAGVCRRRTLTRDDCSVYAFGCLYLYAMLKNTMLYGGVFKIIGLGILCVGFLLMGTSIIHFKHKYRSLQFCLLAGWLLLSLLINIKDYHGSSFDEYMINLVFYVVLGLTITDADFDDIANTAYRISMIVIPMIMILAKLGLIENLVYWRSDGMVGNRRESFGFAYPTDFAAHVFYTMLLHYYRKRGKLNLLNYLVYFLLAWFINRYCDARLTVVSILLLFVISIAYSFLIHRNRFMALWNGLLYLSTPICAVVSWLLLLGYKYGSRIMQIMNKVMSNRLSISSALLDKYGINLFGQYFAQHGFGGTTESFGSRNIQYSYVDMSFLRIPMMFGMVFFLILMILTVSRMRKYVVRREYLIPVIMFAVSICSMVDQHFMDFSYNVFLLTIFINTASKDQMLPFQWHKDDTKGLEISRECD